MKKYINDISKVALSLLLGGLILYWMYRDFNFDDIMRVMCNDVNWTWMLLSFPFGILAQAFRGWRWNLSLRPLGERPRYSTSVNAVFLSYALSLVIPRIGERAIDSLLVALIAATTFLWQIRVFNDFFAHTGTSIEGILRGFSVAGYIVTAVCGVAVLLMLWYLLRRFAIYNKVKATVGSIWQGVMSLRIVQNKGLFIAYTLGIWLSYFLHYSLTFFCFESTAHLGLSCALVTFVVGSIAVIVPTPNGAGPWHFAVKTMLILYGVHDTDALYFVLIVHTVQTFLVVLLGVYAWMALSFTHKQVGANEAVAEQ